jgi:histone H3/H4
MGRLLRTAGANRVSRSAKKQLSIILEEFAIELSRKAITFAKHAGRTTIKGEDLLLATKS